MRTTVTIEKSSKEQLLSPKEFAERLSISRWTVYAMLRDGRVQSVKIGRLVRIPESEVERLITEGRKQRVKKAPGPHDESIRTDQEIVE